MMSQLLVSIVIAEYTCDFYFNIGNKIFLFQTLNRKIMLETKNFKHELSTEMARHKETKRHLSEAMDRISKLEILVETKEKYIATLVPRRNFHNNNRHSILMAPLAGRAR